MYIRIAAAKFVSSTAPENPLIGDNYDILPSPRFVFRYDMGHVKSPL